MRTLRSLKILLGSPKFENSQHVRCKCSAKQVHRSFASSSGIQESYAHVDDQSLDRLPPGVLRIKGNEPKRHTVLSGIQPTGIPHLGNYLGALRTWKDFQDVKTHSDPELRRPHTLFYTIVDLHALTLPQNPVLRQKLTRQSYASLLAIGLDNRHSNVFVQSHSQDHAELMWILSTITSTGYLSRMTQWKTKIGIDEASQTGSEGIGLESLTAKQRDKLKLGLFSYPVLQAADILLYRPDIIPVGEDQSQHVEFTRSLARSFNSMFSDPEKQPILVVPELSLSPARRIMSLRDPTKKMSKSDTNPSSTILITDSKEDIAKKINSAVTDSIDGITYNPVGRPGVSNLISIIKHTTKTPFSSEELAKVNKDLSMRALKSLATQEVYKALNGIGERYNELMADGNRVIEDNMIEGSGKARRHAGRTMEYIRNAVGLLPRGQMHLTHKRLQAQVK